MAGSLHDMMLVDLLLWAVDKRPPAQLIVATAATSEISEVLKHLVAKNYSVVAATSDGQDISSFKIRGLSMKSWNSMFSEVITATGSQHPDHLDDEFQRSPASSITPRLLLSHVMSSLKQDMLVPNDFNVQARLRYAITKKGLKDIPGWTPAKFVERAVAAGELVAREVDGTRILLPKQEDKCWPWIDPSFPCNLYDDKVWESFKYYLLRDGRYAMERSKSR